MRWLLVKTVSMVLLMLLLWLLILIIISLDVITTFLIEVGIIWQRWGYGGVVFLLGLRWIVVSILKKIIIILPIMIVVILTTATTVAGYIWSFVVWLLRDIRSLHLFIKSMNNSHSCASF